MNFRRDHLKKALVSANYTIKQAMKAIDESASEVVLVVDCEDVLIGIATDGDIRRAIINDAPLDTPIAKVMNRDFASIKEGVPKRQITKLMKNRYIKQLPILDEKGRIKDIVLLKEIWHEVSKENKVVLMTLPNLC